MQLLLTLSLIVLVVLFVFAIQRKRSDVDQEKLRPEEVGLIAEAGLDEPHRLDNILRQTWAYFDAHPGTSELTEIHSLMNDAGCQVFEQFDEHGEKATVLLFALREDFSIPDDLRTDDSPSRVILKGPDARERAAAIIKKVLKISDESRSPYQLAGSDGPDHFFDRL